MDKNLDNALHSKAMSLALEIIEDATLYAISIGKDANFYLCIVQSILEIEQPSWANGAYCVHSSDNSDFILWINVNTDNDTDISKYPFSVKEICKKELDFRCRNSRIKYQRHGNHNI